MQELVAQPRRKVDTTQNIFVRNFLTIHPTVSLDRSGRLSEHRNIREHCDSLYTVSFLPQLSLSRDLDAVLKHLCQTCITSKRMHISGIKETTRTKPQDAQLDQYQLLNCSPSLSKPDSVSRFPLAPCVTLLASSETSGPAELQGVYRQILWLNAPALHV